MHQQWIDCIKLPFSISKNELQRQLREDGVHCSDGALRLEHLFDADSSTRVNIVGDSEREVTLIMEGLERVTKFVQLWERLHAYGKHRAEADCDKGQVAL